jgi:hypothetical protein
VCLPQGTHALAEGLLERRFHAWECPNLRLIQIHINSYIQ